MRVYEEIYAKCRSDKGTVTSKSLPSNRFTAGVKKDGVRGSMHEHLESLFLHGNPISVLHGSHVCHGSILCLR